MNFSLGNAVEMKWRMGIILCHVALVITMFVLGGLSYFLKKRTEQSTLMCIVQYLAVVSIFSIAIALVTIDQLVTASITPFLISCIIIGMLFLLKPTVSVYLYGIAFLGYYFALALTQTNQAILLSNRVNGLIAVALGYFLSILLWNTSVLNLQQKQQISEHQIDFIEKNRELERLAYYDQLTGAYNRRKFEELLTREISMMSRYKYSACIVILDIDRFKKINDAYGHPVGDKIIQEVAAVLKNNIRNTDVLSRWGGDEFLILLSHTSVDEGEKIAEKLRQFVDKTSIQIKDAEIMITASFGVAALTGNEEYSYEEAYKNADSALYQAKQNGRNRVEVFVVG